MFQNYMLLAALLCCLNTSTFAGFPYDTRSDSLDIIHIDIALDVRDFAGTTLSGRTQLDFHPLVNGISAVTLDLTSFTVDSVKINGTSGTFQLGTEQVLIHLGQTYTLNDTFRVEVFYHGVPHFEPDFGGFHFSAGFAYNIGVAFQEIPHNFGRTWFPCFDNFIERSTYSFHILTQNTHTAVCTGLLTDSLHVGNDIIWEYETSHEIPSYLVSAAVSSFEILEDSYQTQLGNTVPVWIAAKPSDTADCAGSFQNLTAALQIYEQYYGPYVWERVGYCILPVNGGAMEHATNIAYPQVLVNGNTTYQDVVVHELSHHWWGNLVTCRTAEDMWINEGWAAYSEYLFNEMFFNVAKYKTMVRNNHKEMLHKCHIEDGAYYPISGVPQAKTYGYTSYNKGADMVHTLRSYLGDSLFFSGIQQFLTDNAFQDVDAIEFRDDLSAITGINLTNYFNDWVLNAGWPHISIDSFLVTGSSGNYSVEIFLHQKLTGRTSYSTQVPVTLTLWNAQMQATDYPVVSTGQFNSVTVQSATLPTFAQLNRDEKIAQAVTGENKILKTTGFLDLPHANFRLTTNSVTDSLLFVVEHNWTAPDLLKDWTKGLIINPQRYWRIGGIWSSGFDATATFAYNGRTVSSGYLDNELITGTEDSLVLVYRSGPESDWEIVTQATHNKNNSTDKIGNFTVTPVLPGEYTFALKGSNIGTSENKAPSIRFYPNPVENGIYVEHTATSGNLRIINALGENVYNQPLPGGGNFYISTSGWNSGTYILILEDSQGNRLSQKMVVL